MSKPRHFIKQGIFEAELHEFFKRELAEEGYSGIKVRPTPKHTEIIIRAIKTTKVVGAHGRRAREMKLAICKRWNLRKESIKIKLDKIGAERALDAEIQAEEIKQKLLEGQAVRRVCYRVLRNVMFNKAQGCEIVISGKIRAQRAKAMKFRKGNILRVGEPAIANVSHAIRHASLRQGVLGIVVKVVLPFDKTETGINPSQVLVTEPAKDMATPCVYEG